MKLYCLSGLGVDKRAFQTIVPKGVELIHIEWITPVYNERLDDYAQRLYQTVQPEDGYSLIGVSFGGMVASEFAKIKAPEKLFLISTIQGRDELPFLFKIGSALRIHRILPTALMRSGNRLTHYLFGVKNSRDKKLLNEILKDSDPHFLKWALNAIAQWDNHSKPGGIRIHGSKDRILPYTSKPDYLIEHGGHFMIVNRGKEISEIIEKEMT